MQCNVLVLFLYLARLLKSSNENMLVPVGGIIEECATDVEIESFDRYFVQENCFVRLI